MGDLYIPGHAAEQRVAERLPNPSSWDYRKLEHLAGTDYKDMDEGEALYLMAWLKRTPNVEVMTRLAEWEKRAP